MKRQTGWMTLHLGFIKTTDMDATLHNIDLYAHNMVSFMPNRDNEIV